jgi:hypothetical protein
MKCVSTWKKHSPSSYWKIFLTHNTRWWFQILWSLLLFTMNLLYFDNRQSLNRLLFCRFFLLLLSLSTHFHDPLKNVLVCKFSKWSKVLREPSSEVVRVEYWPKEGWHVRKCIVFEDTTEAKWPEKVPEKLIFVHDSIPMHGISKSLAVSLNRSVSHFRTKAEKERRVLEEGVEKSPYAWLWSIRILLLHHLR